jgi:hypothetical protein
MKFDKDKVLKHHFWIILAGFVLLWVISFSVLLATAGGPIKANRDRYDSAKKKIESKKDYKNDSFLPPWEVYGKMFRDHKDFIWAKAWDLQKDLYVWPEAPDLKMEDAIREPMSLENREKYRKRLYDKQFTEYRVDERLAPVELQGGGNAMLKPTEGFTWSLEDAPTREEMWLAQEDFWVKRDLLEIVRAVEDSTAVMKGEKLPDKELPENAKAHYRFRNESWEIHLVLEQDGRDTYVSTSSTIKNIHPGKRLLTLTTPTSPDGLEFRITQLHKEPVKLILTNEPLPYGHEAKFKKRVNLFPIDPAEAFDVVQVWDWYTSPIKRVTAVKLAYLSSRTSPATLKPNPTLPKDVAEDEGGGSSSGSKPGIPGGKTPGGAQGGGAHGGGAQGGAPPPALGGKGPGGGGGDMETPFNRLARSRYLQVTPQCRHLPLAMVLIVDQHYIPDVLAEVSNSRLRIQLTQVQIVHARTIGPVQNQPGPGGGKPPGGKPPVGPPVGGRPPLGGRPRPGGIGGGDGMGGEGSRPPGGGGLFPPGGPGPSPPPPGPGPGGGKPGPTEADPNLVELGIYGIAALYERFDPSKAAPATPPGDKPPAGNPPPDTRKVVPPPTTGVPPTTRPPATEPAAKAPPATSKPPATGKPPTTDKPPATAAGKGEK